MIEVTSDSIEAYKLKSVDDHANLILQQELFSAIEKNLDDHQSKMINYFCKYLYCYSYNWDFVYSKFTKMLKEPDYDWFMNLRERSMDSSNKDIVDKCKMIYKNETNFNNANYIKLFNDWRNWNTLRVPLPADMKLIWMFDES